MFRNEHAEESPADNSDLATWRVKYFYETFVQGSTLGILLGFSAKNPSPSPSRKPLDNIRLTTINN